MAGRRGYGERGRRRLSVMGGKQRSEGEGGGGGLGRLEELGQVGGRQVSGWASLFFLYFCSVFYLIATEFKFKQI